MVRRLQSAFHSTSVLILNYAGVVSLLTQQSFTTKPGTRWKAMTTNSRKGRKLGYSTFTGQRLEEWQLIAEKALGRPLPVGAEIHHVDEDRQNNDPENLVICPSGAYHSLLHTRTDAMKAGKPLEYRKCPYCKKFDAPENLLQIQVTAKRPQGTCIHRECRKNYLANYYDRKRPSNSFKLPQLS